MKKIITCFCLSFILFGTINVHGENPRPEKSNIVLILTDDLGWQDLKCYDVDDPSAYDTPYLDAFAKTGVKFWQAYSPAPSCSPSRCAIMSGNHPARAQKTHVLGGQPPHARSSSDRLITPWFSGRMPEDTYTLAKAMKSNGYKTGHAGKWHIAVNHHAFPQPKDVGFDFSIASRGMHRNMTDPLKEFATTDKDDPFRLDKNGFPRHENNENAIDFMRQSQEDPFFLYYCTWLVHSPIVTRHEGMLKKYAERMKVDPATRVGKKAKSGKGQSNPFYGAMVECLDYYMGQIFSYLETTDDPRWPGHKLSENTYVIFTSDNGGVVGYTDNTPLDKGKTSAKEGGVRVPLMIAGPNIPAGVESDVMVNGLDFYPTILSLTGTEKPADKHLDGCDIAPLLLGDPTDASLVKTKSGAERDHMMWHFPHNTSYESTIIKDGYKLIRNYNDVEESPIELFQLYKDVDSKDQRVDIEEAKNLVEAMPDKAKAMDLLLTEILTEMKASYPLYNPANKKLPNQKRIPTVANVKELKGNVIVSYQENGATIEHAHLIYTLNGGSEKEEEWFQAPLRAIEGSKYKIKIPKGTTHYFINLIDENQFLVSHPSLAEYKRNKSKMIDFALSSSTHKPEEEVPDKVKKSKRKKSKIQPEAEEQ